MRDGDKGRKSFANRLTRDPVALRRRSRVLALAIGLIGALAGSGWLLSDTGSATLMAFTWFAAPVAAAGIGIGDAFFLRHGIGQRRVLMSLILSIVAGLASCVALGALSGGDGSRELLSGALYFILIVAVIGGLASVIGLGIGRGEGYLSRKVQDVDDTGW